MNEISMELDKMTKLSKLNALRFGIDKSDSNTYVTSIFFCLFVRARKQAVSRRKTKVLSVSFCISNYNRKEGEREIERKRDKNKGQRKG